MIDSTRHAYLHDAEHHALVETMVNLMETGRYTEDELVNAVNLAEQIRRERHDHSRSTSNGEKGEKEPA